jgi:hypothetical protein
MPLAFQAVKNEKKFLKIKFCFYKYELLQFFRTMSSFYVKTYKHVSKLKIWSKNSEGVFFPEIKGWVSDFGTFQSRLRVSSSKETKS